jgi:hypothetical protein
MAMPRDPREKQDVPEQREENREGSLVEFPKPGMASGVRPRMIAIFDEIIEEDRKLLERLATYDRGEER